MIQNKITISPTAHIADESVMAGEVTIGSDSSVFYYSALRVTCPRLPSRIVQTSRKTVFFMWTQNIRFISATE